MNLKVAIITPGGLPIPAVKGGAIETLIDALIQENELHQTLDLTIFSCTDAAAQQVAIHCKCCNFIYVKLSKHGLFFHRVIRKLLNVLSFKKYLLPSAYALLARHKIQNKMFDVIVVEGCPEFVPLFARICKCVILHVHTDVLYPNAMNALSYLSQSDAIFAVSDYIKERISQIDQKQRHKIVTVRNCVDTKLFAPHLHGDFRKQFRDTHRIKESDTVFFFSGRLDEGKGIKQLLQAFCFVKRETAWLVIAGAEWFSSNQKSPFVEELQKIGNSYPDRIIFLGYIDHCKMPEYYAAVDIVVVPSVCYEAAGLSAIEAVSCGKALLASNRGGLTEYVQQYSLCIDAEKDVVDQLCAMLLLSVGDFPNNLEIHEEFVLQYSQSMYYSRYCEELIAAVNRCNDG